MTRRSRLAIFADFARLSGHTGYLGLGSLAMLPRVTPRVGVALGVLASLALCVLVAGCKAKGSAATASTGSAPPAAKTSPSNTDASPSGKSAAEPPQPSTLARQLSRGSMAFDAPSGGLEALVLSTTLDSGALARLAEPFLDAPPPFPPQALERWRANGLRVVGVPVSALESVLNTLAPRGGTAQREWLGQPTSWSELARTPTQPSFLLALDGERLALPAGSLRLLVRAWTRPLAGTSGSQRPRASLRLELLPQHADERGARRAEVVQRDPSGEVIVTTPTLSTLDDGVVFSSLGLHGDLDGSQALVIVFEQPGVDWRRLAEETRAEAETESDVPEQTSESARAGRGMSEDSVEARSAQSSLAPGQVARGSDSKARSDRSNTTTGRAADTPRDARTRRAPIRQEVLPAGPTGPMLPSLGQAMLTNITPSAPPAPRVSAGDRQDAPSSDDTTENAARKPTRRAVIVLVPKVPEHFRILPE